ncbi:MarR family winged helix-turn-helix transcriptional regulator [Streptomyces xanthii]|uniref:MarR family winged helix-turn-helix transcriptional regulator n=2 Tax=Streptomyces xanthii TaxID=2768069 RepID=UPI00374E083D
MACSRMSSPRTPTSASVMVVTSSAAAHAPDGGPGQEAPDGRRRCSRFRWRHVISLCPPLFFDGPMSVNELGARFQVAPATVSLLVSGLIPAGILERHQDEADRRRRIVGITAGQQSAITGLAPDVAAWRKALAPLTSDQCRVFVDTLLAYEAAVSSGALAVPGRPALPDVALVSVREVGSVVDGGVRRGVGSGCGRQLTGWGCVLLCW